MEENQLLGGTFSLSGSPIKENLSLPYTSTHFLQASLREVLGKGVRQSGSLVEEEKFRFDFTHPAPLSKNELKEVSFLLNEKIREDLLVLTEEVSLSEARKRKAITLFEERKVIEKNEVKGRYVQYMIRLTCVPHLEQFLKSQ